VSLIALPSGLYWPYPKAMPFGNGTNILLDASGEKGAFIGRLHIDGRPGTSKTLNTSGSSKIGFGVGTDVFANASSEFRVGIQGVNTSGPVAQPDGTWGAYAAITTAANSTPVLASDDQWIEAVPTSGSSTLSEGDLIAVVFDFVTRAGSDSINISTGITGHPAILPTTNAYVGTPAWQTSAASGAGQFPNVVITFSDGTLGTIDGIYTLGTGASITWSSSGTPDERGMIFQVPFDCKVDALWAQLRTVDATSDCTLKLSSSPTSSRSTLASVALDAAQLGATSADGIAVARLASEVSLSANTDYCVSLLATGAGNVRFTGQTLGAAGHRCFFPGGTTLQSVTAKSGADFGSASSTLMLPIGVRISQLQNNLGSGRAQLAIGGM
jgi:hypothetical protein